VEYTYEVTQLTDNDTKDYAPHVAPNGDISWQREVEGEEENTEHTNVWYYSPAEEGEEEGTEILIGDAPYNEGNVDIGYTIEEVPEGEPSYDEDDPEAEPPAELSYVVYEAEVTPENTDIYYWNSEGVKTPVAENDYNEYNPKVEDNYVVYEAEVTPENKDIYLYDVETETETILDAEDYDAYDPQIVGDYVIYEAEVAPEDTNLYSYNLTTEEATPIAETSVAEGNADVWGNGNAVYEYQTSETNTDIYYYDALTGEATPITDTSGNEINPHIAGNYVAWQGWDGDDWEIYRYDITTETTEQLTDNEIDDYAPDLSKDGHVVYQQDESQYNTDVYAYTDTGTLALGTSSGGEISPEIHGGSVTWQAWDGEDFEVYSAEITLEE